MLKADKVNKYYGEFKALNNVSFEIAEGTKTLLLGPNGAGKTTVIKCIMGLLNFNGSIKLDGDDVRIHGGKIRRKIGYVPQILSFYENITIRQQVEYVAGLKNTDPKSVVEKLQRVDLWRYKELKVKKLSSGMKQRLAMACALLSDPKLLVFDEPMNNVDLKGQLAFEDLVKDLSKEGKTFLIATHLSGLSEFADNAIVIHGGNVIAQGSPLDLLVKTESKDTMYLKLEGNDMMAPFELAKSIVGDSVSLSGGWIVIRLAVTMKNELLFQMQKRGYVIQDVIVEPSVIESEYVNLLGEKVAAN